VKKVGDLLKEYLREKGWLGGSPYDPLFREWSTIAGEGLSRHTRLVDVQNGILLVEVDHPGWLQMLQLRQAGLLEAARRAAPQASVEGIKARVGSGPARPAADRNAGQDGDH
jgi:predicted nucleic acid-binding Zn ribbon protein